MSSSAPFSITYCTIFPNLFTGFLQESLIGKSSQRGICTYTTLNIRDFATNPHRSVDDAPYGGGPGMVMTCQPLLDCIAAAKSFPTAKPRPVILLSPAGALFTQRRARELSQMGGAIFVCGRYEGVDQRVIDVAIDEELSIGDYVLMGGEVAAMAITESVVRLLPGALGNEESAPQDSFGYDGAAPLLEAPQYTRPDSFAGLTVPEELLSGDHKKIAQWRQQQSLARTARVRPELLQKKENS